MTPVQPVRRYPPQVQEADATESATGPPRRQKTAHFVRAAGLLLALGAISLCGLSLADQWQSVRIAIDHADYRLIALAFVAAGVGMSGLGVLWWRCLRVFGQRVALRDALSWYFAGELGKYIPGGLWPVLGRGVLAWRRGGIKRSTGYATTLISYAIMCAGAAVVCGALAPVLASYGDNASWEWLIVGLVPLALIGSYPSVFRRVLDVARRATHGKVLLPAPPWSKMVGLIAVSIPTWLLVGTSSVLVARSLGLPERPARIVFAAVAAWIIGFLAVPVPAGLGLRELVFVALSGLSAGPATAVAAGARLLLVCVDAGGGLIGLSLPAVVGRAHQGKIDGADETTAAGVAHAEE
jgi:uncharacterized membrane protein YbhN (UPF0104 family)